MKRAGIISSIAFPIFMILLLSSCNETSSQSNTVSIPMRDGIALTTDLWFPEAGNGLEKTNIPVFLIGGWYDFGGIGTKESYLHLCKSHNPYIKLLIDVFTVGPNTWIKSNKG